MLVFKIDERLKILEQLFPFAAIGDELQISFRKKRGKNLRNVRMVFNSPPKFDETLNRLRPIIYVQEPVRKIQDELLDGPPQFCFMIEEFCPRDEEFIAPFFDKIISFFELFD